MLCRTCLGTLRPTFGSSRELQSMVRQTRLLGSTSMSASRSMLAARHSRQLLLRIRAIRPVSYSTSAASSTPSAAEASTPPHDKSPQPESNSSSRSSSGGTAEKPDFLNDAESAIWDVLAAEFAPSEMVVQDISGGCGSMYGIEVTSERFRGTNMLKQQRMVNAALGDLMKDWHGVQLRTKVP